MGGLLNTSHTAISTAVILLGFLVSCEPGGPETYGECIVDLGRTNTPGDAMLLCRQAFPEPEAVMPFFVGDFFYISAGTQCGTMSFQEDGVIDPSNRGYCATGSRIECDGDRCRFTCRNYNGSDTATVLGAREQLSGISFHVTDTSAASGGVFRQMADCELAMNQQDP